MTRQSTPDCCDAWPNIARRLRWFTTIDGKERCMPCLDGDPLYRVNVCPSCGAPRRDCIVVLSEEADRG